MPPPRTDHRRWYQKIKWRRVLLALPIILIVLLLGGWWWANSIFNKIEKVDVSDALAHGNEGTNYLIVGSDTAEVLHEGDPGFDPDRPPGQRSDTMMLLRFEGGQAKIMSIPRDLWATNAETGERGKINGSYNQGPANLINTISQELDLPINRYLEVDFASFAGLVDGLGGITINFEHPAHDNNSGLNVTTTGPVELDGEQALAYVRSRHYVETIDGEQVENPTADLGRILRQQAFMKALFAKLGDSKNPLSLARTASKVTDGLRIDDDMKLTDAMRFAWKLRSLNPTPVPIEPVPDGNGLSLSDKSDAALAQFR
ncbi:MAG TPA: LCP family protein [Acidimicrobiales bacterium]|jgi:LCP family protein required for cell wall assembly|nr:LCP family protein [Acidimicrobiales bacterium]